MTATAPCSVCLRNEVLSTGYCRKCGNWNGTTDTARTSSRVRPAGGGCNLPALVSTKPARGRDNPRNLPLGQLPRLAHAGRGFPLSAHTPSGLGISRPVTCAARACLPSAAQSQPASARCARQGTGCDETGGLPNAPNFEFAAALDQWRDEA